MVCVRMCNLQVCVGVGGCGGYCVDEYLRIEL